MLLSRAEFLLMNNPLRAAIQRHYELPYLRRLGGDINGGLALEVGCGRGRGVELVLDHLGAGQVHAFDLDPEMIALARRRLASRGEKVHLWVGDVTCIEAEDATYDAVVDFGIIHHVPNWRAALAEIFRVLRPGGQLWAEEIYEPFITQPVLRRLFAHPQEDRFDRQGFDAGLRGAGFSLVASTAPTRYYGFHIADRPG